MTDTSNGSASDRQPSLPADADEHLRRTSSRIMFGAAITAAVVGVLGIFNGTAGAVGLVALILAGILTWLGFRRRSGASTTRTPSGQTRAEVEVTEADISKAQTLAATDLDIEDICRLTRGAYSWWSETEKARFRQELSKHLDG